MDAYESFRAQLLRHGLGELRGREKKEFFVDIAKQAYEDEREKLASLVMEPVSRALVKTAMLRRANDLLSLDEKQSLAHAEEAKNE